MIADYPAIFYAHSIYEKVTPNDQAVRWGVEARLLARQSNDEIARANGCSAETIEAYEALFFNIRDRLDCRDFIFNIAIGPPPAPGLKNGVNGWLLKLFGFVGGPFVVDAMLGHIPNPLWAHTLDEVAGFFQSTTSNLVKKNAAIAALLIPIAGRTQMQIIKAFAKCMEPERTKDSPGNAQNQIQENVRSLLASLPFTTAVMAAAKQLPNCDRSAAELGTPEHLPVAVENPASDSDEVEALQFQELERVATGG